MEPDHIHQAKAFSNYCTICGERIPDEYRAWLVRYYGTRALSAGGFYRLLDRLGLRLRTRPPE